MNALKDRSEQQRENYEVAGENLWGYADSLESCPALCLIGFVSNPTWVLHNLGIFSFQSEAISRPWPS